MIVGGLGVESVLFREFLRLNLNIKLGTWLQRSSSLTGNFMNLGFDVKIDDFFRGDSTTASKPGKHKKCGCGREDGIGY